MGYKENSAKKLSEVLGLNAQGATVYGEYNNYYFSINLVPYGNASVWQLTMLLDKTLSVDKAKHLKSVHKINIIYNAVNITSTFQAVAYNVILNMPLSNEKRKNYFDTLIQNITNALEEEEVKYVDSCGLCGINKEDEEAVFGVYKGLYIKLHPSCIEQVYEEQKREIALENANLKKLPLSIVLSIVGAIVGIIPSIIALWFGYLFALLFAICPVCAFFGYKIGKAPLRWYATLTAALASLVITALVVVGFGALIASVAQVSLADAFSDPELGLPGLLLQALLFDVIGIGISWGYIAKTRSAKVEK